MMEKTHDDSDITHLSEALTDETDRPTDELLEEIQKSLANRKTKWKGLFEKVSTLH